MGAANRFCRVGLDVLQFQMGSRNGECVCMGKRIYVGNLPWSVDSQQLNDIFAEFGEVKMAEVMSDRETGRSRGFGFVEMAAEDSMNAAIDALNEKEMGGRPLV